MVGVGQVQQSEQVEAMLAGMVQAVPQVLVPLQSRWLIEVVTV